MGSKTPVGHPSGVGSDPEKEVVSYYSSSRMDFFVEKIIKMIVLLVFERNVPYFF